MISTHSLSFVITSWVIHVWLMRWEGDRKVLCKPAKLSGMLVNYAVSSCNIDISVTLVTSCLYEAANWNKWNSFNECMAWSVFKWVQGWLEKLMAKAQGQNQDIVATPSRSRVLYENKALMKRYFIRRAQDLSFHLSFLANPLQVKLIFRIQKRRVK